MERIVMSSFCCPPKHNCKRDSDERFLKFQARNKCQAATGTPNTFDGNLQNDNYQKDRTACGQDRDRSTEDPTYWPSETKNLPDLSDF